MKIENFEIFSKNKKIENLEKALKIRRLEFIILKEKRIRKDVGNTYAFKIVESGLFDYDLKYKEDKEIFDILGD